VRLFVCCYFCPAAGTRPGGVQQVVPEMIDGLAEIGDWAIEVGHPGPCAAPAQHVPLAAVTDASDASQVDPGGLAEFARQVRGVAGTVDVILSIDRLLPPGINRPRVLMCNTLSYLTEAAAACVPWSAVVAPTRHFGDMVAALNPGAPVEVVPYGLTAAALDRAAAMHAPCWDARPVRLRVPHRPDPRKGHRAAIDGLARALPGSAEVELEIAWLDEPRYAGFRRELEDRITALAVDRQVTFCGWNDGASRWDAIEASHGVLQVGEFDESFGLAAVEAILCGRVAITRRQPAVREVVGPTDRLIEVDDPSAWYGALAGWRACRAERRDAAGRLAELTVPAMARGYDRLLRSVCAR
jgi:glycosyltransferase involved in cell wall biosynthesis